MLNKFLFSSLRFSTWLTNWSRLSLHLFKKKSSNKSWTKVGYEFTSASLCARSVCAQAVWSKHQTHTLAVKLTMWCSISAKLLDCCYFTKRFIEPWTLFVTSYCCFTKGLVPKTTGFVFLKVLRKDSVTWLQPGFAALPPAQHRWGWSLLSGR